MATPAPQESGPRRGSSSGRAQRNSRRGQGTAAGRKFSILGADSKCLFCGVNRLVEDGIRGRLLRRGTVQPRQPSQTQQPSPLVWVGGRCILGHSWPCQAFLALRIPIATHLAIRKKMHRLHLASRWDCPPVYFQGTRRCEAPSWAASCLLYPQQHQTRAFRRGRDTFPRPLSTRSFITRQSQASLPDHKLLLCLLPPHPHAAIYPLVLAPPTPSFLTLHFVTTSVPTGRKAFIPSLSLSLAPLAHSPVKGPPLRTFPSTALESSNARATCQSLPQSYQIITPPLQSTSWRPRGSPHHTFQAACIIYGLGSCITPTRALSLADVSTLTRSLLS